MSHSPVLTITLSMVTPENAVVLSKYTSESSIGWSDRCELRYEVHLKQFSLLLHTLNGTATLFEMSHIDLQSSLQSDTSRWNH